MRTGRGRSSGFGREPIRGLDLLRPTTKRKGKPSYQRLTEYSTNDWLMSDGEKGVSRRILLGAGASILAGLAGCGGSGGGSEPGTGTGESTATPTRSPTATETPTATSTPTETPRPSYGLSELGVFEEEYRGMLDAVIMGNFDVPDGQVAAAQAAYANGARRP